MTVGASSCCATLSSATVATSVPCNADPKSALPPILASLEPLRVRAEILYEGGPDLWDDLMSELRERHLGVPSQVIRPSASEQLDAAYSLALSVDPGRQAV